MTFVLLGVLFLGLGTLSYVILKNSNLGATDSSASGTSGGNDIVTYVVEGPGKIKGTARQILKKGQRGTTVQAIPDSGSEFRGWSRTTEIPSRKETGTGTSRTIIAYFQKIGEERDLVEYIIDQPELGTFADGTTARTMRYLLKGEKGRKVEVKAVAGAEFVGWSDGNLKKAREDTGDGEYHRYVATFAKKGEVKNRYEYKVTGSAGNGYIEGQAVQYLLKGEAGKRIVARSSSSAYEFVEWSDGIKNPERIHKGDGKKKILTAKFRKVGDVCASSVKEWNYRAEGTKGYIQGDRVQFASSACGYGKTVTAIAYDGYRFKNWAVKSGGIWVKDKSSQATSASRLDKEPVSLMAIYDTL